MGDSTAAVLGLISALTWGGGDFCGGLAARRVALPWVLTLSAAFGIVCLVGLALASGEPLPAAGQLLWAAAAGVGGALGLSMLYRGLALGQAAVVAPTSAVIAAALPVLFAALTVALPGPQRLLGFAVALLGIWLVSQSGERGASPKGLWLAVAAGCGFGTFFILINRAGEAGGTYWPLVMARTVNLLINASTVLAQRRRLAISPPTLGIIALSALLDIFGNVFFVLSSQLGGLDIASVLSSLYPASTVLLAWGVLHEKLRRSQLFGLLCILAAIVLIVG